jgi:hypothetical protein
MAEPAVAPHSRSTLGRTYLAPGSTVEVRNRFDGRWSPGFEVLEHLAGGYRVRRLSDGRDLPTVFSAEDVRPRRRHPLGTWRG